MVPSYFCSKELKLDRCVEALYSCMMFRNILLCVAAGLLPLGAAVIDFNGVVSSGNTNQSPALVTQGFVFSSGHFHTIDDPGLCSLGGCVGNGTTYLAVDGPGLGLPILMTAVGGAAFSLNGFDGDILFLDKAAAASSGFADSTSIGLVGTLNGGGTLSTSFLLNGSANFQHFNLPVSWANLLSVTFTGLSGAVTNTSFALDNIAVISTPEPSMVGLVGLMLVGLGVVRKK